jgi:hypothetical protein
MSPKFDFSKIFRNEDTNESETSFPCLHSFCVFGECSESVKAYMENTVNLEFRVVCGTQNRLGIRGKKLCVHGKDAKRHKI